ncbi:MAG: hypothetical protein P1V21_19300 [Rhizobiaceae bacterium]|nr:hypothetical protein [Rhizobiaceae bacterium]MDF2372932.1 hypothetical protein [Rhizobiaceae bacterium]|tara:strand:- start:461 stop:685 length:225 start_codon:yes stop_codon:yes gene_type:complete
MSDSSAKSSAIAAAIILAVIALVFLAMPTLVLALGEISPWLGYGLAGVFVVGFFAIFWLRGLYQRRHNGPSDQA